MNEQQDEAYQREYDEALAKLEAGTSPDEIIPKPAEAEPEVKAEEKQEPVAEKKPEAVEPEKAEPDPLKELREKAEKLEKALKDTQAWGTRNAQELAELRKERERQQREAQKPQILEQQPELEEAIRFVTHDPAQEQQEAIARQQQQFQQIVEAVHPGIFTLPNDDELVAALVARRAASSEDWSDPLVMIREVSAEKLALTERQLARKYEAEKAKSAQKSAMSIPGAGGSSAPKATDPEQETAQRYQSMSSADFEKEKQRIRGY
jgi:hypothetical protein